MTLKELVAKIVAKINGPAPEYTAIPTEPVQRYPELEKALAEKLAREAFTKEARKTVFGIED